MEDVSFGEWLKRQRSGRGLTQEQLAHQIGCATITLRKIEAEERRPSLPIIEQLTKIFEIPENEQKNFLKYARGDWTKAPGETAKETPWTRLQSGSKAKNNLPIQLTSFIGREQEINEIKGSILEHRLVTLTGMGGVGKTRLSLQIASDLLDQFRGGVWFVELAPITDPDLIPKTILAILGLPERSGMTDLQLLTKYLHENKTLLILDNCEHLIEASATLVETLLSQCVNLKFLITSREALKIQGEVIWQVSSLSLPDSKLLPAIEQLTQYEAIQLFVQRAALVQPNFVISNDNAHHIAGICIRLDGIPLAIELAAARIRTLSVENIAEHLDDRFRLLTGGSRTALEHQQTLRATLDWSYNLLSDAEKLLLGRLSVFVGGWTLEAAEQVCGDEGSEFDVLDLLTHLTEKSLVALAGSRYHMLETTRQYALEKRRESGEEESVQNNHLAYFLQFARNAEPQLIGPDQAEWLNHLEREHDNFRSALRWCMESGKGEEAAQMSGALGMFWFKHSHYSEGRHFFADILERAWSISDRAQVKAWRFAGDLAFWQGDVAEARRIYTENMERAQNLGDQTGIAYTLHNLANVTFEEGDAEEAMALNKRSISLSRDIDAFWVLAMAQLALGYQEHAIGNLPRAEELYQESLRHCRQLGEKWGMALILTNLGMIFHSNGDMPAAKRMFLESLDLAHELGDINGTITVLACIVKVFQEEGEQITSARLQGMITAKGSELAMYLGPVEQAMLESAANALKDSMGKQAYHTEFETGLTLALEDALKLVSGQD